MLKEKCIPNASKLTPIVGFFQKATESQYSIGQHKFIQVPDLNSSVINHFKKLMWVVSLKCMGKNGKK